MGCSPIVAAAQPVLYNILTISEMSTFPHKLKLLGATSRCRVANMVSEQ
jgi:hypothetical protein